MATAYLFNGFAKYERKNDAPDGELGVTLKYAGLPFWLPYKQVTTIPNFTLREVDHDRSTPTKGDAGELVYRSVIVMGDRIANEMTESQIPIQIKDTGIIRIEGKATGNAIEVWSGTDEDGTRLTIEVPERVATMGEMTRALATAEAYKKDEIQRYFDSKRQRMAGGQGQLQPSRMVRIFMEELNIEDLDDVTAHAKNSGISKEGLKEFAEAISKSTGEAISDNLQKAVQSVRAKGKAQFRPRGGVVELTPEQMEARRESGRRLAAARAAKRAERELAKP